MKKIGSLIFASCLAISTIVVDADMTFAAKEKEIEDVKNERKDIKKDLNKADSELEALVEEIKEINQEIAEFEQALKENKKSLKNTKKDIKEVEEEIEELEERIEKRFDLLKERMQSYQENGGNVQFMEVLFGAEDFNDFISRASAVTTIADSDAQLIEELEEDKEEVESKLDELEELEKELQQIKDNITEQKELEEDQKETLEKKEKKFQKKVKELKLEDDELAVLESELEAEQIAAAQAKKEEEKAAKQEKQSSSKTKSKNKSSNNAKESTGSTSDTGPGSGGKLGWPTTGNTYISSPMGSRWNRQHKGIDIARHDKSSKPAIYAADSGTVEVSQFNNGGYGNYIIINHGNGTKTLYAHMSSTSVQSGQKVSKGEKIGVMGATGNSTGVHLHFEVHKNGSPVNPTSYLR